MAGKGTGNYYRPHPLDLELLKRMPREGSALGFHVLALTVSYVVDELNKMQPKEAPKLTPEIVSGRCLSLRAAGLAVTVALVGGKAGRNSGWQRTLKGEALYEEETGEKLGDAAPSLALVEGGQAS